MSYQACENCGCRMYDGFCTNCDEEVFIQEQYERDGESAPDIIAEAAADYGVDASTVSSACNFETWIR